MEASKTKDSEIQRDRLRFTEINWTQRVSFPELRGLLTLLVREDASNLATKRKAKCSERYTVQRAGSTNHLAASA